MLFLFIRFYIYIDIMYLHWAFSGSITIKSEIPFYISEIIITITLSYILFSVSRLPQASETLGLPPSMSEQTSHRGSKSTKQNVLNNSSGFEESKMQFLEEKRAPTFVKFNQSS